MVIDIHAHYAKREAPWFPGRLAELLPQAGIDKICLFSAGDVFGQVGNDGVLAAARQHPDRIIPFALIELGQHPAECVDQFATQGWHRHSRNRRAGAGEGVSRPDDASAPAPG